MSTNTDKKALDDKKVKEMRRLMAEGGDKAVEHRYGEQAKASPEYQRAAKQKAALKRQAGRQREAMAKEATSNEKTRAASKGKGTTAAKAPSQQQPKQQQPKQSARDRVIAARKAERERPKEALSR
jgi:hypothetical protein